MLGGSIFARVLGRGEGIAGYGIVFRLMSRGGKGRWYWSYFGGGFSGVGRLVFKTFGVHERSGLVSEEKAVSWLAQSMDWHMDLVHLLHFWR